MRKSQPLTREQVREVDRIAIEDFGMPGLVLMENAGRNCAELLRSKLSGGTVTICCGKGNNGGDGFVIARHLLNQGYDIRLLVFADPSGLAGDAKVNYEIARRMDADICIFDSNQPTAEIAEALGGADWIVDALLGTGTSGELREPFPAIHAAINASRANVFAVDIPSGLDCDSGQPLGTTVRADVTATFVAEKLGFRNEAARELTGEVHVIDIGAPHMIIDRIRSSA
ncbi:NAD(P)H-hydrate epimerase [Stratiformator vulcanicus]|uniref:NAD(P)H-hydrate epimerase n=1 Tax=Stratiformator vulcanicus TaxID=2527980 RepID=A0A517QVX3_9PLAN|nr:NAD(P)H-hydrate epimerase [Stratiformator vulcanicus]QDT35717.1 Bifunctional NAD(P)H-hydrate repair enzyme Nnr [Stratiformator vulcanicus]